MNEFGGDYEKRKEEERKRDFLRIARKLVERLEDGIGIDDPLVEKDLELLNSIIDEGADQEVTTEEK